MPYNMPVILCTVYPHFNYDLRSVAADYYVVKSPDLGDLKLKIKMALAAGAPRELGAPPCGISVAHVTDTSQVKFHW